MLLRTLLAYFRSPPLASPTLCAKSLTRNRYSGSPYLLFFCLFFFRLLLRLRGLQLFVLAAIQLQAIILLHLVLLDGLYRLHTSQGLGYLLCSRLGPSSQALGDDAIMRFPSLCLLCCNFLFDWDGSFCHVFISFVISLPLTLEFLRLLQPLAVIAPFQIGSCP